MKIHAFIEVKDRRGGVPAVLGSDGAQICLPIVGMALADGRYMVYGSLVRLLNGGLALVPLHATRTSFDGGEARVHGLTSNGIETTSGLSVGGVPATGEFRGLLLCLDPATGCVVLADAEAGGGVYERRNAEGCEEGGVAAVPVASQESPKPPDSTSEARDVKVLNSTLKPPLFDVNEVVQHGDTRQRLLDMARSLEPTDGNGNSAAIVGSKKTTAQTIKTDIHTPAANDAKKPKPRRSAADDDPFAHTARRALGAASKRTHKIAGSALTPAEIEQSY